MIRRLILSRWTVVALALTVLSVAHLWPWGLIDVTGTISLVELEWSLAALTGSIYSIDFIRECLIDGRAARLDQEADRLFVEMLLLIGGLLLGLHLVLLTFGVATMLSPTSPSARAVPVRVLGVALTVAGEQLILTLVVIRRKRARIRELAAT